MDMKTFVAYLAVTGFVCAAIGYWVGYHERKYHTPYSQEPTESGREIQETDIEKRSRRVQ